LHFITSQHLVTMLDLDYAFKIKASLHSSGRVKITPVIATNKCGPNYTLPSPPGVISCQYFSGDVYSLFVNTADRRHCQDWAVRAAALPSTPADDVRHNLRNHLHHVHHLPQHITSPRATSPRLWEDGKISGHLKIETNRNAYY